MTEVRAVITQQEGTVSRNFEEVKGYIRERLKECDGAVFTEESKGIRQKERQSSGRRRKRSGTTISAKQKRNTWLPGMLFEPKVKS